MKSSAPASPARMMHAPMIIDVTLSADMPSDDWVFRSSTCDRGGGLGKVFCRWSGNGAGDRI